MAKKKTVKKSRKKTSKKVSNKSVSNVSIPKKRVIGFNFLRIALLVIFVYGVYYAWSYDWLQGVYVISASVIIWLVLELIKALRK